MSPAPPAPGPAASPAGETGHLNWPSPGQLTDSDDLVLEYPFLRDTSPLQVARTGWLLASEPELTPDGRPVDN